MTVSDNNDGKFYGIHISTVKNNNIEENLFENISSDKHFVDDLIKYFYENSVDSITVKDVLSDILKIKEYN